MITYYGITLPSNLLSGVFDSSKTHCFSHPVSSSTHLLRVAALAMVMGLCLLVYSLGQKALRQALERARTDYQQSIG